MVLHRMLADSNSKTQTTEENALYDQVFIVIHSSCLNSFLSESVQSGCWCSVYSSSNEHCDWWYKVLSAWVLEVPIWNPQSKHKSPRHSLGRHKRYCLREDPRGEGTNLDPVLNVKEVVTWSICIRYAAYRFKYKKSQTESLASYDIIFVSNEKSE